jgi:hypothetical protein
MYLYETMSKENWMDVWDTLEAQRRESERLTEKYRER